MPCRVRRESWEEALGSALLTAYLVLHPVLGFLGVSQRRDLGQT